MSNNEYPSNYIEEISLRDGTPVLMRPIRPDDAPRLQAAFTRLSPQTIYMRFLEIFRHLSDEQAHYFANVNYQSTMALVGEVQEDGQAVLVAVARYAMIDPQEPGVAEAAIVVRDDFQNRGLGSIAMDRLAHYARDHGVRQFLGTIHATNARIMHFIRRSNQPFSKQMIEPGVWEIRVHLDEEPDAA
ncbi:MAG: GNAT family N-acetyltransferase [Anaerolineales bacterium]|nr:GNAT family N-acetyltransferase [Anaerolineales bacterium]